MGTTVVSTMALIVLSQQILHLKDGLIMGREHKWYVWTLTINHTNSLFQFNAKSGVSTDLLKVVSFTACTVKNFKPSQQCGQFNGKPHGLEGTSKRSQK